MFASRIDDDLELRLLEARHAEELFQVIDDCRADLRTWLGWVDAVRSVADIEAFIRATLQDLAASQGVAAGIWHDGRLAGVVSMRVQAEDRAGEIGYWLAPAARGRGLMTRATRTLVDHGFGALGLHRIQIRCATGNSASRAIPERLGFALEGVQREAQWVNDRCNDLALYAMLRHEWPSR